ncbi:MAG TPA: hypothetical protein VF748_07500 [Candidatus Acidoferrum sp.]
MNLRGLLLQNYVVIERGHCVLKIDHQSFQIGLPYDDEDGFGPEWWREQLIVALERMVRQLNGEEVVGTSDQA